MRPVLSARNRAERAALDRRLWASDLPPPHGVSLHESLLDRPFVHRLRDRVEVVMTWPVNDPATLDRVVGLGVNGVISDDPAILRAVLRGRPG